MTRPRRRTTLEFAGYPIRAAGLLLFFVEEETRNMCLLLQRRPSTGEWEDLGGKVEEQDRTFFHTMAREASEESRKRLSFSDLMTRLLAHEEKNQAMYFVGDNKYIFTLLPATPKERYDIAYPQDMEWVPVKRLHSRNLFVRLRHPSFLEFLELVKEHALPSSGSPSFSSSDS